MIECSTDYIWYKKRRKLHFKKLSTFLILFLIFLGLFLYYKFLVVKQIYKVCSDYVFSYSAESINFALLESLSVTNKYSDLIYVEKNSNGDITLLNTNSYKVNLVSNEIAIKTKEKLKEKLSEGVPIPLLTFSGIELLAGYGPHVNYKTINVASVSCNFVSEFTSTGINQTLHSIYINVESNVEIESLFNKNNQKFNTKILVSEAVLIGKIPEIYLNSKIFE